MTIQLANVSGSPALELIGRRPGNTAGVAGLYAYSWTGAGWRQIPPVVQSFVDGIFGDRGNYQTIQAANITGSREGRDQLIGRTFDGIVSGYFGSSPLSRTNIWYDREGLGSNYPDRYLTIQTADVDGNGSAELFGRYPDDSGIKVFRWDFRNTVWQPHSQLDGFHNDAGWNQAKFYRTIQAADVDGDPQAEMLFRDASGLKISHYDKGSRSWSQPVLAIPALSDAAGYNLPQSYETIQTADVYGDDKAEVIARGLDGIHTWTYDQGRKAFVELHAPSVFPDFSGDPERQKAYEWIGQNEFLTRGTRDIRAQYTNSPYNDLWVAAATQLTNMLRDNRTPAGIDPGAFEAVARQLITEFSYVDLANTWFKNVDDVLNATFAQTALTLASVTNKITIDNSSQVDLELPQIILGFFSWIASAAGPAGQALAIAAGIVSELFSAAQYASGSPPNVQAAVADLQDRLQARNSQAHAANDCMLRAVKRSWALLKALGEPISSNELTWPDGATDAMAAAAQRGYEFQLWQTLTPLVWTTIGPFDNDAKGPCWFSGPGGALDVYPKDPDGHLLVYSRPGWPPWAGDIAPAVLFVVNANCSRAPSEAALRRLFLPPNPDGSGGFGIPLEDPYCGNNGWVIPGSGRINSHCEHPWGSQPQVERRMTHARVVRAQVADLTRDVRAEVDSPAAERTLLGSLRPVRPRLARMLDHEGISHADTADNALTAFAQHADARAGRSVPRRAARRFIARAHAMRALLLGARELPPRARIVRRAASVDKAGVVRLRVRCPRTAVARCRGIVRLLRHGRGLGRARFSLPPGRARRVAIDLNRRGRRIIARRRALSVRAQIVTRHLSGKRARTVRRVTLRAR